MTILVVDQWHGPSPYLLQQTPIVFEALLTDVREHPTEYGSTWRPAKILDVQADGQGFTQPWATTAYRADAHGMTEVWRARWDSSD